MEREGESEVEGEGGAVGAAGEVGEERFVPAQRRQGAMKRRGGQGVGAAPACENEGRGERGGRGGWLEKRCVRKWANQ